MIRDLGIRVQEGDLAAIMRAFDRNGNGKIDYYEFYGLIEEYERTGQLPSWLLAHLEVETRHDEQKKPRHFTLHGALNEVERLTQENNALRAKMNQKVKTDVEKEQQIRKVVDRHGHLAPLLYLNQRCNELERVEEESEKTLYDLKVRLIFQRCLLHIQQKAPMHRENDALRKKLDDVLADNTYLADRYKAFEEDHSRLFKLWYTSELVKEIKAKFSPPFRNAATQTNVTGVVMELRQQHNELVTLQANAAMLLWKRKAQMGSSSVASIHFSIDRIKKVIETAVEAADNITERVDWAISHGVIDTGKLDRFVFWWKSNVSDDAQHLRQYEDWVRKKKKEMQLVALGRDNVGKYIADMHYAQLDIAVPMQTDEDDGEFEDESFTDGLIQFTNFRDKEGRLVVSPEEDKWEQYRYMREFIQDTVKHPVIKLLQDDYELISKHLSTTVFVEFQNAIIAGPNTRIGELQQLLSNARVRAETLAKSLDRALDDAQKCKTEYAALSIEYQNTCRVLREQKLEFTELRAAKKQLQVEASHLRSKVHHLENHLAILQQCQYQYDVVQKDNVALREKLDRLERDFDRTQRRLGLLERRAPWLVDTAQAQEEAIKVLVLGSQSYSNIVAKIHSKYPTQPKKSLLEVVDPALTYLTISQKIKRYHDGPDKGKYEWNGEADDIPEELQQQLPAELRADLLDEMTHGFVCLNPTLIQAVQKKYPAFGRSDLVQLVDISLSRFADALMDSVNATNKVKDALKATQRGAPEGAPTKTS
jgi:hypothetical protein